MTDTYMFNVASATKFTDAEFVSRYFPSLYNPNAFIARGHLNVDSDAEEEIIELKLFYYLNLHLCFKCGLSEMTKPPYIPKKLKQLIDEANLDFEFLVRTNEPNCIYTGMKPVLKKNVIIIPTWKFCIYDNDTEEDEAY